MTEAERRWTLLGRDGTAYESTVPGTLGGNGRARIYGRLDCGSAFRALRRGRYAEHRVFFLDVATARAAGYRPCGTCLRTEYDAWKTQAEAAAPDLVAGPPASGGASVRDS